MYPQTMKLMEFLRQKARVARKNNQKIARWVDSYVDSRINEGKDVVFFTQWCLSKGLERRFPVGSAMEPQRKETEIFRDHIPAIFQEFTHLGVGLEWWISFNRGFTDSRKLDEQVAGGYQEIIRILAEQYCPQVGFLDWEKDVLCGKSAPDKDVLSNPLAFMSSETLQREIRWAKQWQEQETTLKLTEQEIYQEVVFQAACEAEEGRFMLSSEFPLGECVLVPLEVPEQFVFFNLSPGFSDRIAAILPPYPWRTR